MVRQFKFRAWSSLYNKMYTWDRDFFSDISPVTSYSSEFPNDWDNLFLMQWTYLSDKNGVDIYEGDILKYEDGSDSATLVVYWDSERLAFDYKRIEDGVEMYEYYEFGLLCDSEIIGNIYENPIN